MEGKQYMDLKCDKNLIGWSHLLYIHCIYVI